MKVLVQAVSVLEDSIARGTIPPMLLAIVALEAVFTSEKLVTRAAVPVFIFVVLLQIVFIVVELVAWLTVIVVTTLGIMLLQSLLA